MLKRNLVYTLVLMLSVFFLGESSQAYFQNGNINPILKKIIEKNKNRLEKKTKKKSTASHKKGTASKGKSTAKTPKHKKTATTRPMAPAKKIVDVDKLIESLDASGEIGKISGIIKLMDVGVVTKKTYNSLAVLLNGFATDKNVLAPFDVTELSDMEKQILMAFFGLNGLDIKKAEIKDNRVLLHVKKTDKKISYAAFDLTDQMQQNLFDEKLAANPMIEQVSLEGTLGKNLVNWVILKVVEEGAKSKSKKTKPEAKKKAEPKTTKPKTVKPEEKKAKADEPKAPMMPEKKKPEVKKESKKAEPKKEAKPSEGDKPKTEGDTKDTDLE